MRGVFLVAAELSRLGYSVALTARNAAGADLLVFHPAKAQSNSIEVKTNAKRASFWLLGPGAKEMFSSSHFYVFVNISTSEHGDETFDYYVVPSEIVAKLTVVERNRSSTWFSFRLKDAEAYREQWAQLGSA